MSDNTAQLSQQIETAIAEKTALHIIGGNTKAFYGREPRGQSLHVAPHSGITSYEPTELVISARAGTTLDEIQQALNAHNQMLAFEPPQFGPGATIGGTVACNLSGPRRATAGAARDFVLGTKIINGKAEVLHFGGEVMKNVAGYDVSRLMVGAMGTLGVLLEISLKVLPKAESEITLVQEIGPVDAIAQMNQWAGKPLPISATAYIGNKLYVRLSGATSAVQATGKQVGGEYAADADNLWCDLLEHKLAFFTQAKSLWRICVPQTTSQMALAGNWLVEWGGGLRWLSTEETPQRIIEAAKQVGGHARCYKGCDRHQEVFQPLDEGLAKLHIKLKAAFDPLNIFNPGRMYKSV